MKTPQEIAAELMSNFTVRDGDIDECSEGYVADVIAAAIEADRKQRDIYELIAEALDERAKLELDDDNARHPAAEVLRATSAETVVDTTWDEFIGPMLDGMEEVYGDV